MLMVLLTTCSLLLLPWNTLTSFTMLLTFFMLTTSNITNYVNISSWLSMDSMSQPLIILSFWITAMMMMASYKIKLMNNNKALFSSCCNILLITIVLCFSSSNLIMFYIWFEASLIPTTILILTWGYQPERLQASLYFILYTVTASLPMLCALLMIYYSSNTAMMSIFSSFSFPTLYIDLKLAWLVTIMGLLVKLPMYSTHLWLPKAHVEAPVAGSMILAAILLKLGGYGLMRLTQLFPHMKLNLIISVSLVGAAITSLICMRQPDLKSLIAYSSVGHMGLLISGLMSSSSWGMKGAMLMMISHGFSSSALFSLANMNYEMTHTRSIILTKGMLTYLPSITMWWFMFSIMNMAAPPSINLLSEIMLITAISHLSMMSMMILMSISFLSAAYSLFMYTAVTHGHMSMSTNPMCMKSKDHLIMLCHIFPTTLMMKPEMLMWIS